MKKIISIILVALIVCMTVSVGLVSVFAEVSKPDDAQWLIDEGDNHVWWKLDNDTLIIGGEGNMPDFDSSSNQPWYEYRNTIKTIKIESGVTRIGNKAFCDLGSALIVTIASSVKEIGQTAFFECSSMEIVSIDSIESWCDITFENQSANPLAEGPDTKILKIDNVPTTDIVIPETVENIPDFAFIFWKNLKSVTISEGVKSIGKEAFRNCYGLKSVTIPSTMESIGQDAFCGEDKNKIDTLNISSIESWCNIDFVSQDSSPFFNSDASSKTVNVNGKAVTDLVIPGTVDTISKSAFDNWSNLNTVRISEGVESIEKWAFADCQNITSVYIPSSVSSIAEETFVLCPKLTTILVKNSTPPQLESYNAFPYGNKDLAIYVPYGSLDDYQYADIWEDENIAPKLKEAYVVNIDNKENGIISVDKEYFSVESYTKESETVNVTVTPEQGYILKSLEYNDGEEDYDISEAKTFTMPLANVTVTAEFEDDPAWLYKLGDSNDNKNIEITDATLIQRYLADLYDGNARFLQRAGIEISGEPSIIDVTLIQKYIAHISTDYDDVIETEKKYIIE